jgi:hypothetical protein
MIVVLTVAAVVGIAFTLTLGALLLERLSATGGDRPDPDDDGGRGGNGGTDPDDGPPWWPDFERRLAEYIAAEHR